MGKAELLGGLIGASLVGAAAFIVLHDWRPEHAEWRQVCVESTTEVTYANTVSTDAKGNVTVGIAPVYTSHCLREEAQCVPGKDGSTVCDE